MVGDVQPAHGVAPAVGCRPGPLDPNHMRDAALYVKVILLDEGHYCLVNWALRKGVASTTEVGNRTREKQSAKWSVSFKCRYGCRGDVESRPDKHGQWFCFSHAPARRLKIPRRGGEQIILRVLR